MRAEITGAASPAGHDHDLRDPRPGRGDDHGRPDRRAARRPGGAGGHAARSVQPPGESFCRGLHRFAADEFSRRHRRDGGRRARRGEARCGCAGVIAAGAAAACARIRGRPAHLAGHPARAHRRRRHLGGGAGADGDHRPHRTAGWREFSVLLARRRRQPDGARGGSGCTRGGHADQGLPAGRRRAPFRQHRRRARLRARTRTAVDATLEQRDLRGQTRALPALRFRIRLVLPGIRPGRRPGARSAAAQRHVPRAAHVDDRTLGCRRAMDRP